MFHDLQQLEQPLSLFKGKLTHGSLFRLHQAPHYLVCVLLAGWGKLDNLIAPVKVHFLHLHVTVVQQSAYELVDALLWKMELLADEFLGAVFRRVIYDIQHKKAGIGQPH